MKYNPLNRPPRIQNHNGLLYSALTELYIVVDLNTLKYPNTKLKGGFIHLV
jgi:hypothetical protein